MGQTYKIVYSGAVKPGIDPRQVITNLMANVGLAEDQARQLIEGKRKTVLKKGMERAEAERYRAALEGMGLLVGLETEGSEPAEFGLEPQSTPAVSQSAASVGPRCPKCGSDRIENDSCLDCGIILSKYQARLEREAAAAAENADPYAAPGSDLESGNDLGEITGPRKVPASRGWTWILAGFGYWRKNPFAWILALLLWMVIIAVTALIPFAGFILVSLFGPVFMAGFSIGADAQEQGEPFTINHLFAGFSQNFGQLVLVGLFYMIGSILITVAVGVAIMGVFTALGGMEVIQSEDPNAITELMASPSIMLAMLLGLALLIPLLMAYWFAPTLVALNGLQALTAFKLSFFGCLKNILPFLLYGLVALILTIVAVIPFGLGLLILSPVMIASIYASYRDIYLT